MNDISFPSPISIKSTSPDNKILLVSDGNPHKLSLPECVWRVPTTGGEERGHADSCQSSMLPGRDICLATCPAEPLGCCAEEPTPLNQELPGCSNPPWVSSLTCYTHQHCYDLPLCTHEQQLPAETFELPEKFNQACFPLSQL